MEVENGAGVEDVFQYLTRETANVSSALKTQGILQIVQCSDGRDCVKQIKKIL